MSELRISLFGRLTILADTRAVAGLEARKAQELLCYLLLHRGQPHSRERLAALLWAHAGNTASRSYLRKALWQLQSSLDAAAGSHVLEADPEWIRLVLAPPVWVDVAQFDAAYEQVKAARPETLTAGQVAALQQAVALYRGDLLEGWYLDWCLFERERMQRQYMIMLEKLMGHCELTGDLETGLQYGELVLEQEPAHEAAHRRLMLLRYKMGDRTGALRQYERCVASLERELAVTPDPGTVRLCEQIRTQRPPGRVAFDRRDGGQPERMLPLRQVLERLRGVRRELGEIHNQVELDIKTIEAYLDGEPRPTT